MKTFQIYQQQSHIYVVCVVVIVILCLSGFAGCGEKAPIKIGFSGCLTGRLSDLGIAGRNGVMLAVEQMNEAGGINGRSIELLIKDDRHDPQVAIQVDQELIQEGVAAIIGHMTSAMSTAALPVINQAKMVLLSPTSTSNDFTGMDDYFFRTALPDKIQTEDLARYTVQELGVSQVSIVYDLSNRSFTEGWQQNFRAALERQGGSILQVVTFTSGQDVSYLELTEQLLALQPGAILSVAGALDTALICQQMRKLGSTIPLVSSGWAKTPELIKQGGTAVEGVVLPQTHNEESMEQRYLLFKQQFKERFGTEPNFAAAGSYDAAQLLFQALERAQRPEDLKQAILQQNTIQGLQGEIRIDQYGDAQRKTFLITVKNGEFTTIR